MRCKIRILFRTLQLDIFRAFALSSERGSKQQLAAALQITRGYK